MPSIRIAPPSKNWNDLPDGVFRKLANEHVPAKDGATLRMVAKSWRDTYDRAGLLDARVAGKIDEVASWFLRGDVTLEHANGVNDCGGKLCYASLLGGSNHLFKKAADRERHPAMRCLFGAAGALALPAGLAVNGPSCGLLATLALDRFFYGHHNAPKVVEKRRRHQQRRHVRRNIDRLVGGLQRWAPAMGPASYESLQRAIDVLEGPEVTALKMRHPAAPLHRFLDSQSDE